MKKLCTAALVLALCLAGCRSVSNQDGSLDMEKFAQLVQLANESDAEVEMDVSVGPGKAGLFNGVEWDLGIRADARFRWEGGGDADK